jgi:hypothetical protein
MKAVIDSGTMITFSSTCLVNVFKNFVEHNKIELFVSEDIEKESVWRPIKNKRFSLNASRIKHLLNSETISVIQTSKEIELLQSQILSLANNSFIANNRPIKIIQLGEAEALALAKIYGAKALFIDERTTRSLIENPFRLKQVLEKRQHTEIKMNENSLSKIKEMFSDLKVFRSVDIVALAYEQNLFDGELDHGKIELEAALYATKYSGCAVSEREIVEYLKKM